MLALPVHAEPVEVARLAHGREPRPLALDEGDLGTQRVGHHEDVREQDRGIEAEAADRLQGDLDREVRRVAELEKAPHPCPYCPVLGQVAARLAHEPERRRTAHLAPQGRQERLLRQSRLHHFTS